MQMDSGLDPARIHLPDLAQNQNAQQAQHWLPGLGRIWPGCEPEAVGGLYPLENR